ncbi:trypsin-like serine protease [Streptomyces cavernae]|uniref:trypsin-like serine protease n=1 Tax=Streptomyces cavernae TaxID=2259034 RepID=UPI000FEBE934|nr:trypsin-like serine protease [Streptomyces cavernae]
MKHALPSRWRRPRTALSAAAIALALGGAGAVVANTAIATGVDGASGDPGLAAPAAPGPTDSAKELRGRLLNAAEKQAAENKDQKQQAATEGSATAGSQKVSPFIVGGSVTAVSSSPWMVQLGYYDSATDEGYFCGGTLVAPNKVLTAAHCVAGLDWVENGTVQAGSADLGAGGTTVGVWQQWVHPGYNPSTVRNDIAVLTLNQPLKQQWLRLAASNDSALYKPGTTATVYGWGLTSGGAGAELSAKLRKVNLPLVADSTCNSAMRTVLGKDIFAEGSMICAGTPATGTDEGTKSPCNGDSGGPLVVAGKVVGVVSWGVEGCTGKGAYPVFTKVSAFTGVAQPRIDDTNLSFDGRADLMARTPSGNLYQQNSKGKSLAKRKYAGNGWQSANWMLQADLDRNWDQDLIHRDKSDGKIHRMYWNAAQEEWKDQIVSTVWGGYKSYAIPGDLTGDARPDLVALDAYGSVFLYPGKGNGQFNAKVRIVNKAWKGVKLIGHGDLTGDGKADLLVRNSSGTVYLYRGTGVTSKPFATRITARTGWKFTAYVASGDVTGDGKADLMARDSGGKLWLYPGTGKASSSLFGTRISLGAGYNQYNLLF